MEPTNFRTGSIRSSFLQVLIFLGGRGWYTYHLLSHGIAIRRGGASVVTAGDWAAGPFFSTCVPFSECKDGQTRSCSQSKITGSQLTRWALHPIQNRRALYLCACDRRDGKVPGQDSFN